MRTYLICYDIADPKRLGRVHRYLKTVAVALQYSVFVARLRDDGLARVMRALAALIHPACDDIRIYPVPANPEWRWLGDSPLPDDVHLLIRRERGGVEKVIDAGVTPEVNSAAAEFIVNPVSNSLFAKPDSKGGVKPQI